MRSGARFPVSPAETGSGDHATTQAEPTGAPAIADHVSEPGREAAVGVRHRVGEAIDLIVHGARRVSCVRLRVIGEDKDRHGEVQAQAAAA